MLAAQHAPIGAKICTIRAIRTMGRKFFSRRRIAIPSASELITLGVRSREQVPGFIFQCRRNEPVVAVKLQPATLLPYLITYFLVPFRRSATGGGEFPIISQIAGILNNRC